jgi:multicomponent Na+:H+ antiporter subunit E
VKKFLPVCIGLFAFWLLLSFTWQLDFVLAGLALALPVAWLTYEKSPGLGRLLNPVRLLWVILYVPYFLLYCIRANLYVAYRVLHPDVPIRPGIVKVRTALRSQLAKTFLANSITLTPGTLTVDIDGQDLYVHWINVRSDDPEQQTAMVVKRFEGLLGRIFE